MALVVLDARRNPATVYENTDVALAQQYMLATQAAAGQGVADMSAEIAKAAAWAESPTSPDPTDPTAQSAKTIAGAINTLLAALRILTVPDEFQFGRALRWSVGSQDGQTPLSLDELGYLNALHPFRALGGLLITRNGTDGFWDFDPRNIQLDAYRLNGGGSMKGGQTFYSEGLEIKWEVGDIDGKIPLFVDEEGTTHAAKLAVGNLSGPGVASLGTTPPAIGDTHAFKVDVIDGAQQILATALTGTVPTQVTSEGRNYAPVIRGDKVIFWSTRDGFARAYWMNENLTRSGSSLEHPVYPNLSFLFTGHSFIAGGWGNRVAAHYNIAPSSPVSVAIAAGGATAGGGIGSQQPQQIGSRFGAAGLEGTAPLTATFSGNQISAGNNQLTAINWPLLSRVGDTAGAIRTLRAWIGGVSGLLKSVQKASADATTVPSTLGVDNYTYTFTPDAGQALPVAAPPGTIIEIDPETRQEDIVFLDFIRNAASSGPGWQAVAEAWGRAILSALKPFNKKVVVYGCTNSRKEYATATGSNAAGVPYSQVYAEIVAFNPVMAAICAEYGAIFHDARPILNAGEPLDIPRLEYLNPNDDLHPNQTGEDIAYVNPTIAIIDAQQWLNPGI